MPNSLDGNGLQVVTQNEIVAELTEDLQEIYGEDINVESNSPDGQVINIFAQMIEDLYELSSQIFSSFDPEQAVGNVLDQRCAINGIQRKAGTYTYVMVDVTVDRSLTLQGLDSNSVEDSYTVSDSEGNQFVLADTTTISNIGTTSLRFRAANIGKVEVLPNTITAPVTIILGVTAVNNPAGAVETGRNEETDAQLRERRKISLSISGQGYSDSLRSALLNIPDVTACAVYNNRTNVTDSDGIPAHSIWVIVEGGTNKDIGEVMNDKIMGGVGMKGSQSVVIPQADGSNETYYFDRPSAVPAYVKLTIQGLYGQQIDPNYIKNSIADNFILSVYEPLDSSAIICYTKSIQENISVECQVSSNGTNWYSLITPSQKNGKFTISAENITII